jgi:lambda repressor-like predicted transcriptional regulator
MGQHRKGPPTDKLAIEYASGISSVELAKKYNMTPSAITSRLRRNGFPIRPPRRRAFYDDSTLSASIVNEYQSGIPMTEVAKRIGTSHSTVRRILAIHNCKIRPHGLRRRMIRIPSDPAIIGYFAGLLDGEGNLQLKHKHHGKSVGGKMAIYSTTPGVMSWLNRNIGGIIRWDTKRTTKHGWKPMGIWEVYRAQDMASLLKVVFPMLIVKRKQAKRLLQLYATRFEILSGP